MERKPTNHSSGTLHTTIRREGVTRTERYLSKLAERSFLSLWSYPGLFKEKGKELCDLLVLFENDIIIFSDKEVQYGDSGNSDIDWARWYSRAIAKSANQVYGAERWLRSHPDRIYLDPQCTRLFPFPLPDPTRLSVHRVVVAHDPSGRRRTLIGGSGSLHIAPGIQGKDHILPSEKGGSRFAVGQVDPAKGFVHVLDDSSLHLVLGELDTITDFVWYLKRKESFISSGGLWHAAGEEELLAYYLKNTDKTRRHNFPLPVGASAVVLEEGHYRNYVESDQLRNKREADEVSYLWDDIAARFCTNALNNTLHSTSDPSLENQETLIRFLAREPRVRRRMLARALLGKVRDTSPNGMSSRMVLPSAPGDPYYIFVVVPRSFEDSDHDYRRGRAHVLATYMAIAKRRFPMAQHIVGLATEARDSVNRSEDLALLSGEDWTAEDEQRAAEDQRALGLLTNMRLEMGTEHEYPEDAQRSWISKKIPRNAPCPCGSTYKFKKCCGRFM